jgi:hypothetical protein
MFFAAACAMACSSCFFIICLSLPVTGLNDRQLHRIFYGLGVSPVPGRVLILHKLANAGFIDHRDRPGFTFPHKSASRWNDGKTDDQENT